MRKYLHKMQPSPSLVQLRMCNWHVLKVRGYCHGKSVAVMRWLGGVGGGSTVRCSHRAEVRKWAVMTSLGCCAHVPRRDAVRYGSIDQSDLSISAGAHIGPIRWCYWVVGPRRDAVRYGTVMTSLASWVMVHGANQSSRFFFSVVKYGISQIRILVPSIKHCPNFSDKRAVHSGRKGVYKTLPHYFR